MATTMVAAVPRSMPPPSSLSALPRVRPPRFLPGQPRDDQKPQPEGVDPEGKVWVQGKWRQRNSMAVIHRQKVVSKQIKKAVEQAYQGLNIYAYYNMNTKQVVYSLTRIMQSGQIMPQLVNHGKKTVPEALRRDIWRPYFAIKFPDNDGGRKAGLKAYQRLREFALRRQLDPPEGYLMTTQADVDRAARKYGSPLKLRRAYQKLGGKRGKNLFQLPLLGQKLPQQLRARKLMDQRASSVADTSFVLGLALEQLQALYPQRFSTASSLLVTTKNNLDHLGPRGRKRMRNIRRSEAEEAAEIARLQKLAETVDQKKGQLPLDKHIAQQLATQFGGTVEGDSNRLVGVAPTTENNYKDIACEIQVNWSDLRDGTYAESWPQGVFHGQLQPRGLIKNVVAITQEGFTDKDGVEVSTQWQKKQAASHTGSVHVHGDDAIELGILDVQRKNKEMQQWVDKTTDLYQQHLDSEARLVRAEDLAEKLRDGEELTEQDRQFAAKREEFEADADLRKRLFTQRAQEHPQDTDFAREVVAFRKVVDALRAEETEATKSQLTQAEQSHTARVAAAKEFVAKGLPQRAEARRGVSLEEGLAVRSYLEQPGGPMVGSVKSQEKKGKAQKKQGAAQEKKGIFGTVKSWFGR